MNMQAFTLAFRLWLEDVKLNNEEIFSIIPKPIDEVSETMALEFDHWFNEAITQLGEKYEDAAASAIVVHRGEGDGVV